MLYYCLSFFFFFSSRRRHTRLQGDWSSDVCSSDLLTRLEREAELRGATLYRYRSTQRLWVTPRIGSTPVEDRKSTRLNSSHLVISYAVFCLKKKKYRTLKHVSAHPLDGL